MYLCPYYCPGTEQVTYVADNGQELFSHTYSSILQCCLAVDGISFAYIARREKDDKYLCHVFQALTYEEVREERGEGEEEREAEGGREGKRKSGRVEGRRKDEVGEGSRSLLCLS